MTAPQDTFVVISYNIRLGVQLGLEAIAEAIAPYRPDILALQEVGNNWYMGPEGDSTRKLATLLNLEHSLHVPAFLELREHGPDAHYGHALLSRFPFASMETFSLPQNADEPRAFLFATLETAAGPIEVISTHLSHRESDRPQQASFLRDWLERTPCRGRARFLLGDFNATPEEEDWVAGLLADWQDADGTGNRPTFPADDPRRRIDYVLAQNARCLEVEIGNDSEASDHLPVISRWHLDPVT